MANRQQGKAVALKEFHNDIKRLMITRCSHARMRSTIDVPAWTGAGFLLDTARLARVSTACRAAAQTMFVHEHVC
eukprot:364339-Chlamydomonas_euryale.AAC.11